MTVLSLSLRFTLVAVGLLRRSSVSLLTDARRSASLDLVVNKLAKSDLRVATGSAASDVCANQHASQHHRERPRQAQRRLRLGLRVASTSYPVCRHRVLGRRLGQRAQLAVRALGLPGRAGQRPPRASDRRREAQRDGERGLARVPVPPHDRAVQGTSVVVIAGTVIERGVNVRVARLHMQRRRRAACGANRPDIQPARPLADGRERRRVARQVVRGGGSRQGRPALLRPRRRVGTGSIALERSATGRTSCYVPSQKRTRSAVSTQVVGSSSS